MNRVEINHVKQYSQYNFFSSELKLDRTRILKISLTKSIVDIAMSIILCYSQGNSL